MKLLSLAIGWILVSGCTGLKQYRGTDLPPEPDRRASFEGPVVETTPLVGYVEFDDHGWLWDTNQLRQVMTTLQAEDDLQGLMIVVFAHGWKHNARTNDSNVEQFREILAQMQATELKVAAHDRRPPRKVAGVYLGWRGLSQNIWLLNNLTFWERKNTAHLIGQGAVAEVLVNLDTLRTQSRIRHKAEQDAGQRSSTMLVTMGHSFGCAVLYTALAPFLEERLVNTLDAQGNAAAPRGFGDLVVLINPAFEAARFQVLKSTSDRLAYPTNQTATIAIFTSRGDWATRYAFPAGRFFSTFFEKNRSTLQSRASRSAVGHFEDYLTHDLNPTNAGYSTGADSAASSQRARLPSRTELSRPERDEDSAGRVVENRLKRIRFRKGDKEPNYLLGKCVLDARENRHHPRDPVYVVYVDSAIIPSHDAFRGYGFMDALQEFILTFSGNATPTELALTPRDNK